MAAISPSSRWVPTGRRGDRNWMRTSPARSCNRQCSPPGFTLVELMVVMGLLALVMLLALPALQNLLEGSLQREVRRLSGVVRL
ncbi:MAG: type II secretion system protein, partial [Lysobacterales bacterium]